MEAFLHKEDSVFNKFQCSAEEIVVCIQPKVVQQALKPLMPSLKSTQTFTNVTVKVEKDKDTLEMYIMSKQKGIEKVSSYSFPLLDVDNLGEHVAIETNDFEFQGSILQHNIKRCFTNIRISKDDNK
eukprot:TRINITY_DN147704_c0_g1_i1.p1 TRINITY_DN147704_c0_g1~~TRINITY_DN147704_c0_g1_i1.p1  ORF type:complete len:127 (-),score=6.39 TRINITY_DN147704_c0_g1_i1:38-418(-)